MKSETIDRARDAAKGPSTDQLVTALRRTVELTAGRALSSVEEKVLGATEKLTAYAESGGRASAGSAIGTGVVRSMAKGLVPGALKTRLSRVRGKLDEAVGSIGGSGADDREYKVTTIVEEIDVGVPVTLAYDQWTRFTDFPEFMNKVEDVEQESDEKVTWKAQVFLSHRSWESTIVEQVPDERIVWRSKGDKGYVDGAVTFHEVTPDLTRIILVLEYHPKGLFERTGNLWRAQGRRARLELQHFQRHLMARALLHPDEVEGWRGEIHDGEVVSESEAEAESEAEEAGTDTETESVDEGPVEEEPDQAEEETGETEERGSTR